MSHPTRRLIPAIPRWCVIIFLTVGMCACSAIDRTPEIKRTPLQIGVSTKTDVVNAIGLPLQVDKNAGAGTETWYYTGKAQIQGYFIGVPVASRQLTPTTRLVYVADIGPKNIVTDEPVVLTCLFSPDGRLVQAYRNETAQQ